MHVAAWVFPDFKLLWLAEETKKNLPLELDFEHEGQNADRVRGLIADCEWVKVIGDLFVIFFDLCGVEVDLFL